MRPLFALLAACVLAACAPDPFGVDCRTSPSCQKREDEKRRTAQTNQRKSCEQAGLVWVAQLDQSATALKCDPAQHACDGSYGCAANQRCASSQESQVCHGDGGSWEGHCIACANRSLLQAGLAKEKAQNELRARAGAAARAIAEDELKRGTCSDAGRATMQAGVDAAESDWKHAGAPHKRGTVVANDAGIRVEVDAIAGKRYTITAGGFSKVQFESKVDDWGSGSWGDQLYGWVRGTVAATTNTVAWTIKGTGCVAWNVVRIE
jgi:hypothetical protein